MGLYLCNSDYYLTHLATTLHLGGNLCSVLILLIKQLREKHIYNARPQNRNFSLSSLTNTTQEYVESYIVQGLDCSIISRHYTLYVRLSRRRCNLQETWSSSGDFILYLCIINQRLKVKIWWYLLVCDYWVYYLGRAAITKSPKLGASTADICCLAVLELKVWDQGVIRVDIFRGFWRKIRSMPPF